MREYIAALIKPSKRCECDALRQELRIATAVMQDLLTELQATRDPRRTPLIG